MIIPVGKSVQLQLVECDGRNLLSVSGNREKALIVALTSHSILLYTAQPQLLVSFITHGDSEVHERGHFESVVWSQDSSKICVLTSKSHVLIYNVLHTDGVCYSQSDGTDPLLRRTSQELFIKNAIPKLKLQLSVIVRLASNAKCIIPVRDELLLCLQDGWMHRIEWAGHVKDQLSSHISQVSFSHDQLHSKGEFCKPGVYIVDAAYSPLVNGLSAVLSNGKGALIVAPNFMHDNMSMQGVWCANLDDCVCTSINHKYRLIAFGCKNGDVCAYHVDETTGSLIQAFRVAPTVKDGPDDLSQLGAIKDMSWSPYGNALAVIWTERRVAAIFSVFGAQLWCEAEGGSVERDMWNSGYSGIEWGPECYQLWLCGPGLSVMSLLRSAALNNPAADQSPSVCLMGSDCVYVSPPRSLEDGALAPHSAWRVVNVPADYMASAWPLRYCAFDPVRGILCVAGTRGLAHFNLESGKWRLFGNETQERELIVTGGLALWKEYAVAACFHTHKQQDDFRFYPLSKQLDNCYASVFTVNSQLLMINVCHCDDVLVTFDVTCRICLFSLKVESSGNVSAVRCAEVIINDLVPHPACVITVHLTALKHDTVSEFCASESNSDTLLVNIGIGGKLMVLSPQPDSNNSSTSGSKEAQQLRQPLVVASYVEHIWHPPLSQLDSHESTRPHLHQALWLQCGAKGTKVWLPLFPSDADVKQSRAFISKRIMLPFDLTVYPFAFCSRDCLALGAESVANEWKGEPLWNPHRNTEVFLHHLLRQLLKRNLGVYALQIAATCRPLPYFGHVLELLLHQVLEEEATSSEPIPDPLLPRVVAFIQEFPEMLQTVAHCARKTELALWSHLFTTAGNPRDLFEECLREGKLSTAASFLIVLQNMESAHASKHHAIELLEASLAAGNWQICHDIVRFLKAIDPSDIESPPRTPMYAKQVTANPRLSLQSPTNRDADAFIFQPSVSRQRQSSVNNVIDSNNKKNNHSNKMDKNNLNESDRKTGNKEGVQEENSVVVYLVGIVNKHLRMLLSTGKVRDMGACAAHLDVPLVQWLTKERAKAARIKDWPVILNQVHNDFEWPLPVLSRAVMTSLHRKMSSWSLSSSQSKLNTPLQVITSSQSGDSGVRTLELGVKEKGEENTRRLLVKQQQRPSSIVLEETAQLEPAALLSAADSEYSAESGFTSPVSETEFDWQSVEQLCGDSAARGPSYSEAQLRFLQQIMAEAGCVEWSVLLCVVLRDLVALARAVNCTTLSHCPPDTTPRLNNALNALDQWADDHCVGYKPLISAVQKHLLVLSSQSTSSNRQQSANNNTVLSSNNNATSKEPPANVQTTSHKVQKETHKHEQHKAKTNSNWKGEMPQTQMPGWNNNLNLNNYSEFIDWGSPEIDDIHVDIVNANTPTEQQSNCNIM